MEMSLSIGLVLRGPVSCRFSPLEGTVSCCGPTAVPSSATCLACAGCAAACAAAACAAACCACWRSSCWESRSISNCCAASASFNACTSAAVMIEGGAAGAAAAAPDPAAADPAAADPATAGAALASFEATVTGPALCAQLPAPNAATVSAVKNTVFAFMGQPLLFEFLLNTFTEGIYQKLRVIAGQHG